MLEYFQRIIMNLYDFQESDHILPKLFLHFDITKICLPLIPI